MYESESEEDSKSEFYYPEDTISGDQAALNATDENQKSEAPALQNSLEECLMPYNKLFINLACSVCTEKYRTLFFFVQTLPYGLGRIPEIKISNQNIRFVTFRHVFLSVSPYGFFKKVLDHFNIIQ